MLKDTLENLSVNNFKLCKFGTILKGLDGETQGVLMKVVKDPSVSARSIASAMVSEGIDIHRSTVDKVRQCLSGQHKCSCPSVKECIK